eukprot:5308937-Prymnesium_polylepis.1
MPPLPSSPLTGGTAVACSRGRGICRLGSRLARQLRHYPMAIIKIPSSPSLAACDQSFTWA